MTVAVLGRPVHGVFGGDLFMSDRISELAGECVDGGPERASRILIECLDLSSQ